jgi:VWFA-related protein
MTRLVGITAACLLATALSMLRLGAAPQFASQHPTFRGGVELVDVDVVVFDKTTGQPIRGLTAGDFTIVDRKAPQTIQTFSAIDFDRDPNEPALPPSVPLDVADNRTARSTRIVLILVDDLHIAETLTARTKDVVRRVLRDLGPQATVGLAFTSGRPGVELTEDRALVYDQIDTFRGMQKLRGGGVELGTGPAIPGGFPALARDPSGELGSTKYWLSNSLHATIAADAKVLGTETLRRKAFVLVSEGVPMDIQGLFDTMEPRPPMEPMSNSPGAPALGPSHGDMDLLNAMTAMRRANVALYAIDPGASVPRTDFSAAADMPGAPAPTAADPSARLSVLHGWNSPSVMSASYLTQLSDFSGGFAITSGDSLEAGLATLLGDLDHYYMLGFVPAAADKKWHDLQVTVDRPDVVVRARRGYQLGAATMPPKNAKEPLSAFAAEVLPATELPLKMFATPLPSAGQKLTRMAITMQIHADRDALRDPDGELRDTLHMFTMALDLQTRKLTKTSIKRERQVLLKPLPDAVIRPEIVYQIVSEWELPPGRYQLRTTVESDKMHKAGAVYLVCDVPDFRKADVALSGLVVGFADPARRAVDGTAVEHELIPLEPVLERVFSASDVLRLSYDVWRKNGNDAVTTELRILDDARRFVRQGVEGVPVTASGHVDVKVSLTGLAPGPYVLAIVATDRGKTDVREVGFFVK